MGDCTRYQFPLFKRGEILQPYLKVRVQNPTDALRMDLYCLLDTGADTSIFSKTVCIETGHNFQGQGVRKMVTYGVDGGEIETWMHTYTIHLYAWGQAQNGVSTLVLAT